MRLSEFGYRQGPITEDLTGENCPKIAYRSDSDEKN